MKKLLISLICSISLTAISQYTPGDGVCELPTFRDWSTGNGANPCACTWYDKTTGYILCSYGNCGDAELDECAADCALYQSGVGYTNGRWHQGGGNYGFDVCNLVLGVELLSFVGKAQDKSIELIWETVNEKNSAFFEVYHSVDGINFDFLTLVRSANTEEQTTYVFKHHNVAPGNHYYKLVEVDKENVTNELAKIVVDNTGVNSNDLFSTAFVDKETSSLKFFYYGSKTNEEVNVKLTSMSGQILFQGQKEIENNQVVVSSQAMKSGMYFVELRQGEKIELKKVYFTL